MGQVHTGHQIYTRYMCPGKAFLMNNAPAIVLFKLSSLSSAERTSPSIASTCSTSSWLEYRAICNHSPRLLSHAMISCIGLSVSWSGRSFWEAELNVCCGVLAYNRPSFHRHDRSLFSKFGYICMHLLMLTVSTGCILIHCWAKWWGHFMINVSTKPNPLCPIVIYSIHHSTSSQIYSTPRSFHKFLTRRKSLKLNWFNFSPVQDVTFHFTSDAVICESEN